MFIFTLGTRGDVQPYLALATGLRDAGHQPTICTSNRFGPFVREHGLHFSDFNDEFMALLESHEGKSAMEASANPWARFQNMRQLMKKAAGLQRTVMFDGWNAVRAFGPDVIVFHPKAYGGAHFAEKLGIPSVMALAMPVMVPTGEFPVLGFPLLPLGRAYNRATYQFMLLLMRRMFARPINEWRAAHGLTSQARGRNIHCDPSGAPLPVLHGYSRQVGPVPADWPAAAVVTGYWFLDRKPQWQPPPSLTEFLQAGTPPVYVGFGSMSGNRAKERTEIVIEALARVKVRGVIASGWGGLSETAASAAIHFMQDIPHDWLFPRMAAVVHHGGAGTTAAGLRAGRPTVICPFIFDQPFWGRCLHERGLSPPPIPQKRLTVEKLAAAIQHAVTDKKMEERCRAVAAQIAAEDGIGRAVKFLESIVRD